MKLWSGIVTTFLLIVTNCALSAPAASPSALGSEESQYDSGDIRFGVRPLDDWKACKTNSDCVKVDPLCSNCCGTDAISKKFGTQYDKYKQTKCSEAKIRLQCDCQPSEGSLKCVNGRCQFVEKK